MQFARAAVALLVVAAAATLPLGTDVVIGNHGTAPDTNYTVELPHETDHYPGTAEGRANGTHLWTAPGRYDRHQMEDGFENVSHFYVRSQEVDFSECTTDNTARFGVDRDSDDPGTETDLNLDDYVKEIQFTEHGIVVDFYEGTELGSPFEADRGGREAGRSDGDGNLELYHDDQIVLEQGQPARDGPCYVMPRDRGWYQLRSGINGTSFDGRFVEIADVRSHYFYVCVCDSRQSAVDTLGPPPSGGTDGTATATPTVTQVVSPTATGQGTVNGTVEPVTPPTERGPTATEPANRDGGDGGDSGELTPAITPGLGSGFGIVAVIVALVAAALLATRRLEY